MRHKILVVDDEENIRFIIKEAFSGEYQVFTASEGLGAVEIIKKENPALVFLDMNMPGTSGLEVLRLVKEAGLSPVIWMLTADDDLNDALTTLNMGAAGYLTKPFEIGKIRDIVTNTTLENERKKSHDTRGDRPWRVKKKSM